MRGVLCSFGFQVENGLIFLFPPLLSMRFVAAKVIHDVKKKNTDLIFNLKFYHSNFLYRVPFAGQLYLTIVAHMCTSVIN